MDSKEDNAGSETYMVGSKGALQFRFRLTVEMKHNDLLTKSLVVSWEKTAIKCIFMTVRSTAEIIFCVTLFLHYSHHSEPIGLTVII